MLFCCSSTFSQKDREIGLMVQEYLQEDVAQKKYDLIQSLMEADALLSLNEAKQLSFSLKTAAEEQNQPLLNVFGDLILADVFFYKNQLDSAIYYYVNQALSAEIESEAMLAGFGYGNAAYCLEAKGQLGEALLYRNKAKSLAPLSGDDRVIADAYFNIGNLYSKFNEIDSSSLYLKKTIELDRKVNNMQGMVHNITFLINQYIKGDNFEEAKLLCEECVRESENIAYKRGLATCYHLFSIVNQKTNKFEESLSNINKAIKIDQERNDATRMGQLLMTKAEIYESLNPQEAVELYKQSIYSNKSNDNIKGQCAAILDLANYYYKLNDFENCEIKLEEVAQLIKDFDIQNIEVDYLDLKYELLKKQGQLSSANNILERKNRLMQSKMEDLITNQTSQLSSGFDLYKVEKELDRLALEHEISQLRDQRKKNIYILLGLSFLFTTLIAYFAFQNQKNKNAVLRKNTEEEKLKLNYLVLEKEMDALRSQMNPHFLFNSLNSINDYIMHSNPKLASNYLAKFSKLMRTILNNSKNKFVSLDDELKAISLYLEMEKLRFKDKFDFEISLPDEDHLGQFLIPSMLIQPYVENAVKHGMMHSETKGFILVKLVLLDNGRLEITVKDNGIGRANAALLKQAKDPKRKSLGHEITNSRIELLNQIYNVDAKLNYRDLENPTGTEVIISLTPISKHQQNAKS